jgi:predicted PurR-regulated permease PerM
LAASPLPCRKPFASFLDREFAVAIDVHPWSDKAALAEESVPRGRMHLVALAAVTGIAFYLCYRIAEPFLPGLVWAVTLAILGDPAHRWLTRRVGSRDWAAGISVTVVVLAVVLPGLLVAAQLVREAPATGTKVQEHVGDGRWREVVARVPYSDQIMPWLEANVKPEEVAQTVAARITNEAGQLLTGSMWAGLQALVALFVLYFCFRDRGRLLAGVRKLVPLPPEETEDLFTKVSDSIHATVYGTVVTGVLQGVTGGLMFWLLGLPAPVLWGVVMAILSILPVLGAFLVWVPAAALLAVNDRWGAALALVIWGVLMAGPVCNAVYAHLAAGRMRLHPAPTLIAFIGGLAVFGVTGMILGPAILSLTFGLIEVWRHRTENDRVAA